MKSFESIASDGYWPTFPAVSTHTVACQTELSWVASFRLPSKKCAMCTSLFESSAMDDCAFSVQTISRYWVPSKISLAVQVPDAFVAYFSISFEDSQ